MKSRWIVASLIIVGFVGLGLLALNRLGAGQEHQRDVMRDGLAVIGLDPSVANGATYRRIDLRGNDCSWIDSSARRLADETIGFDDAEPAASALEADAWTVRRWVVPGASGPTRFEITAAQGRDQLRLSIADGTLGLYVDTRPCAVRPEDLGGIEAGYEVDRFPD